MDNPIITHLTTALKNIAEAKDAPELYPSGQIEFGLHCGVEDQNCCDRYEGANYGYEKGMTLGLEWAVNEANHALESAKAIIAEEKRADHMSRAIHQMAEEILNQEITKRLGDGWQISDMEGRLQCVKEENLDDWDKPPLVTTYFLDGNPIAKFIGPHTSKIIKQDPFRLSEIQLSAFVQYKTFNEGETQENDCQMCNGRGEIGGITASDPGGISGTDLAQEKPLEGSLLSAISDFPPSDHQGADHQHQCYCCKTWWHRKIDATECCSDE